MVIIRHPVSEKEVKMLAQMIKKLARSILSQKRGKEVSMRHPDSKNTGREVRMRYPV